MTDERNGVFSEIELVREGEVLGESLAQYNFVQPDLALIRAAKLKI
jgi:hypothetical protein